MTAQVFNVNACFDRLLGVCAYMGIPTYPCTLTGRSQTYDMPPPRSETPPWQSPSNTPRPRSRLQKTLRGSSPRRESSTLDSCIDVLCLAPRALPAASMSFAIEVPGEANPLSVESLCRTLEAATSHDHPRRQAAGQQLASWDQKPGYFSSLQVPEPALLPSPRSPRTPLTSARSTSTSIARYPPQCASSPSSSSRMA